MTVVCSRCEECGWWRGERRMICRMTLVDMKSSAEPHDQFWRGRDLGNTGTTQVLQLYTPSHTSPRTSTHSTSTSPWWLGMSCRWRGWTSWVWAPAPVRTTWAVAWVPGTPCPPDLSPGPPSPPPPPSPPAWSSPRGRAADPWVLRWSR